MPKTLSIDEFVNKKTATPVAPSVQATTSTPLSIDEFVSKKTAPSVPEKKNSLLKEIGIGITKMPARAALNIYSAGESIRGLLGNKEAAVRGRKVLEEGADSPTYGKIRPIGNTGKGLARDMLDAGGAGLEAASYFPLANAPALVGQTLKQGIVQGAKTFAKEGAVAGLMAGVGTELQNPEATVGSTATSGLIGTGIGTVGAGLLGGTIGGVTAKAATGSFKGFTAAKEAAKKAMGQILQGDAKDVSRGLNAVQHVDLKKTKTSAEAAEKVNETIGAFSEALSEVYDTNPLRKTLDNLLVDETVGGQTISTNYVKQALDQMEEHYVAIGDVKKTATIRQLRQKAETEGLTSGEINRLAILHGADFSGYNLNGTLSSGITKQASENAREGLKYTARKNFGHPIAEAADKEISDLIRVRDLLEKQAKAVNKETQKLIEEKVGAYVARKIFDAIDVVTLGTFKGALKAALPNLAKGTAKGDAIAIEEQLAKNLKIIQKAADPNVSPKMTIKALNEFLKSNGMKPLLELPAPGQTSAKSMNPTLYVTPKGTVSDSLQEATDAAGKAKLPRPGKTPQPILKENPYFEPYVKPNELPSIKMGKTTKNKR